MKKNKITILIIILVIVTIISLVFIKNANHKEFKVNFSNRLEKVNEYLKDELVLGWIQVQGTNIDLPVYNSKTALPDEADIEYAWVGDFFPNNGEFTRRTIGSHNVLNVSSMPSKEMDDLIDFEPLMAFVYRSFAKDNLYIKYTNKVTQEEEIYKIYAIGFYDYGYDQFSPIKKENKEEIDKYIKSVKENSIYDYDVDVTNEDDLLMIYTCTRFFGLDTKQQIFIDARKVRKDEKIEKYSVKKTKLFDELGMFN